MRQTFRDLESGVMTGFQSESPLSSLAEWYLSVRDTPLDALGVEDLCRAVRQELYLSEVLPFAVELLRTDVLEGYKYDGELIVALGGLSSIVWEVDRDVALEVLSIVEGFSFSKECSDVELDASKLILNIRKGVGL
ncbi:contact-dependent growth inhibition system immunity protein [Pseudomonas fluorescens]|uniref:contact-dependent growth inhibition system immunity protein n=1 Tax=Pseudomonas fluorescens TaxID=294 RepID=UPI003D24E8A4